MEEPDITKISMDKIQVGFLQNKKVELDVLRLDKIHPVISGNKWFKLKYHLLDFNAGNYKGILTLEEPGQIILWLLPMPVIYRK
jgi:1-aminocyclopropane-1-carboxylate deaminase